MLHILREKGALGNNQEGKPFFKSPRALKENEKLVCTSL